MIQKLALVAAVILPLWNIPLIARIIKRRSSKDLSLYWALGVWVCLLVMFPAGLMSEDVVWKAFNIVNFFFFSCVALCAVLFHRGQ